MSLVQKEETNSGPIFPRRAFVAAGLSAMLAGGMVTLGLLGGASAVERDVFRFSRGVSLASGEEARLRGLLSKALVDARIAVTIVGHTGNVGDAQANLELSQARADVAKTIAQELGIGPSRVSAVGVGGGAPLARQDGESERMHQTRLARLEVSLQLRR